MALASCASFPEPRFERHSFPENAFIGDVKRPYVKLGIVRSKVDFETLDVARDEEALCSNYFNKAVEDLLRRAKKIDADAVIDVRSVVFLADGRSETYPSAECADEGAEGQVLVQGVAVRWKKEEAKGPEKSPSQGGSQ